MAAIVTAAKASFTSHRATLPAGQPALAMAVWMAQTGAVVNQSGAWACTAWLTMRASGARPRALAVLSRISTRAAAPSEMLDEVAAVMAPSFLKAGFSVG